MIRPLTLLGIYGEDPSFGDPTCLAGLATNQVEIDISRSVLGYSIPLSVFPMSYLHPDQRGFHIQKFPYALRHFGCSSGAFHSLVCVPVELSSSGSAAIPHSITLWAFQAA